MYSWPPGSGSEPLESAKYHYYYEYESGSYLTHLSPANISWIYIPSYTSFCTYVSPGSISWAGWGLFGAVCQWPIKLEGYSVAKRRLRTWIVSSNDISGSAEIQMSSWFPECLRFFSPPPWSWKFKRSSWGACRTCKDGVQVLLVWMYLDFGSWGRNVYKAFGRRFS